MIKAIIFDIGGVLVPNLFKRIKNKLDKRFTNKIDRYDKLLNLGKISLNELEKIYEKSTGKSLKNIYINAAKNTEMNKKVKNLVFKLNKNYKVVYLSNTSKEHYLIRKKQGVYKRFLFGINSYKVKMKKPYRIIYKLMLRKLKLNANECLFIDDQYRNLKTANRLKINTILFKNYPQLVNELKKFNVKL